MPDSRGQDEIYVGYLPVPPRQKHFLRWMVPAALWIACGACFLWARSQHAPGAAVWDQGRAITLRGTVLAHPYPMLLTTSAEGEPEFVLLVEVGKHGGGQRIAALDAQRVIVTGWPLIRDGRRIMELEPSTDALLASREESGSSVVPLPTPSGRVTLRGEIVDSKCYLGAMKPGEGKTHKECATLCIRGGIPPMFITRDSTGKPTYYLLQGPGGRPLDPAIQPFIADPIELSGDLSAWANLRVLTISPADISRL